MVRWLQSLFIMLLFALKMMQHAPSKTRIVRRYELVNSSLSCSTFYDGFLVFSACIDLNLSDSFEIVESHLSFSSSILREISCYQAKASEFQSVCEYL